MRAFLRPACPRAQNLTALGIATVLLLFLRTVLESEKAATGGVAVEPRDPNRPLLRKSQHSADPRVQESTTAHGVALPQGSDRAKEFRIMFVGDSITEGIYSPMSAPLRGRAPKEGSCSYRFHLLQLLHQKRDRDRSSDVLQPITPVGPFGGHVGSHNTPPSCIRGVLEDHFTRGITDRHAAIWGVTAAQLTGTDSLYHTRQFARKHYFGKKAQFISSKDASWTIVATLSTDAPQNRNDLMQHHLRRWSAAYRPTLATLLLGTNDLSAGAQVDEVVLQLLPEAALQLVCPTWLVPPLPSSVAVDESLSSCSGTRLAVATLLPRTPPLQRLVEDVNSWLAAIRHCKRAAASQCVSCVTRSVPLGFHRTRDNVTGRTIIGPALWQKRPAHSTEAALVSRAAVVWCLKQVVILNISSPTAINASEAFMYDGLHPNARGERTVAELIADGLVEEGII